MMRHGTRENGADGLREPRTFREAVAMIHASGATLEWVEEDRPPLVFRTRVRIMGLPPGVSRRLRGRFNLLAWVRWVWWILMAKFWRTLDRGLAGVRLERRRTDDLDD